MIHAHDIRWEHQRAVRKFVYSVCWLMTNKKCLIFNPSPDWATHFIQRHATED